MKYLKIVVTLTALICLTLAIVASYKMAIESEDIYDRYIDLHKNVAADAAYQNLNEKLKIELLHVEDLITSHSDHEYRFFIFSVAFAIIFTFIYLVIALIEVRMKNSKT
jgi:hypothetical protein